MLVGSHTANTQHHEHLAALRIQAHFRGRQARVRHGFLLGGDPSGHAATGHIAAGEWDSTDSQPFVQEQSSRRSTRSTYRRVFSLTSSATAADYGRLVNALEARESCWPPRLQSIRIAVYLLLEEPHSSRTAQALSTVILVCIIVSIAVFMLETMPELDSVPDSVWDVVEVVCTIVFTLEYLFRMLVCDVVGTPVLKFVRKPMNLVDLAAILPFYLWLSMQHLQITKALGILRTVRLVRLFRVFKLGRYSSGLRLMIVAVRNSSHALWVLACFLGIGVVLFSSSIYFIEKMGCPDRGYLALNPLNDGTNDTQLDHYVKECRLRPSKTNAYGICCTEYDAPLDFPTIIEAFWWSIVTMTTVGFGDVRPRTGLGKFVGTATMLSGVLLIALPIAIIGRKFQEAYACFMQSQNLGCSDVHDRVPPHEAGGQLSMAEMGRRLKLMRLPEAGLATMARELAEELEEVGVVQKEIASMQAFEQARQLQAVEHFGEVVARLCSLSKPTPGSQAKLLASIFGGPPKKESERRSSLRKSTPLLSASPQNLQQILESKREVHALMVDGVTRMGTTASQPSSSSFAQSPPRPTEPSRTTSHPLQGENAGG